MEIPAGASSVDVVVTLTTDYGTTKGDWPDLAMRFKPTGGTCEEMKPGEFHLRPSPGFRDTATVTWLARSLDGGGQAYLFRFDVDLHRDSLNRFVTGRRTVVIIDVRSSEG